MMSKKIKTRVAAVKLIEKQLDGETEKCTMAHYGRCELRELLDFIYGEEPKKPSEKINN